MTRFPFLLLALLVASTACGQEIQFRTSYLSNGQEVEMVLANETSRTVHQVSIEGQLGGKGKLFLDGNACSVNQFGDRTSCTEVFYPPLDVTLEQVAIKDPQGTGRKLYSVNTDGIVRNYSIRLVVPATGKGAPRLLLNSHIAPEIVIRNLTLETCATKLYADEARKRVGKTKTVSIVNFGYDPPIVTVNVGDSVKWINEDDSAHTATRSKSPAFDTGLLQPGEEKKVTFHEASGKLGFEYFCSPHPFMQARVIVLAADRGEPEKIDAKAPGFQLAQTHGCFKCHSVDEHKVGPAYSAIADRYRDSASAHEKLTDTIKHGGKGNWRNEVRGSTMPPHSRQLSNEEVAELTKWLMKQ